MDFTAPIPHPIADAFGVRDQVVIVTGAAGHIGPRIATVFAENGAHVLASDRPGANFDQAMEQLRAAGDVLAAPADLTQPDELRAVIALAEQRFGRLNSLICCGAIGTSDPLDYEKDDNFDRMFHTNVRGNWQLARYATALLEKSGGGSIVNISSVNGHRAQFACSLYAGTKAALLAMTREMSVELAPRLIRINSVSPGSIPAGERHAHHMADRLHEPYRQQFLEMATPLLADAGRDYQPLPIAGKGEDIAMACVYLCSHAARFVTGTDLLVDGAMLQNFDWHGARRRDRSSAWQKNREWLLALPEAAWKGERPHWLQRPART